MKREIVGNLGGECQGESSAEWIETEKQKPEACQDVLGWDEHRG
jgi:hypothetical protein